MVNKKIKKHIFFLLQIKLYVIFNNKKLFLMLKKDFFKKHGTSQINLK